MNDDAYVSIGPIADMPGDLVAGNLSGEVVVQGYEVEFKGLQQPDRALCCVDQHPGMVPVQLLQDLLTLRCVFENENAHA